MAFLARISRPTDIVISTVQKQCSATRALSTVTRSSRAFCIAETRTKRPKGVTSIRKTPLSWPAAQFHTTTCRHEAGDSPRPPTDFAAMDVLGNTPVPSTTVDICQSDGFQLNSGAKILDGSGVILVGGEAFEWKPWLARGEHRLLNSKGQWEIPNEAFGLLSLLWPRPDLLVIGVGPEIRPLSPELRRYISSLGMRVEILDTRNAASQFNLLVTERGVNDVAAALIPIGWKEGIGANW
ncbi:hypothetical protein GGS20DRAFT_526916 [Poronia punctata]|nr:hypothetical protein GGS20DRAFT_526916 [Poronia punctata]